MEALHTDHPQLLADEWGCKASSSHVGIDGESTSPLGFSLLPLKSAVPTAQYAPSYRLQVYTSKRTDI